MNEEQPTVSGYCDYQIKPFCREYHPAYSKNPKKATNTKFSGSESRSLLEEGLSGSPSFHSSTEAICLSCNWISQSSWVLYLSGHGSGFNFVESNWCLVTTLDTRNMSELLLSAHLLQDSHGRSSWSRWQEQLMGWQDTPDIPSALPCCLPAR